MGMPGLSQPDDVAGDDDGAPSTTMPTANANPASEITLILRPARCSAQNVASKQMGIVVAMMTSGADVPHEPPHAHQREQCADDQVLDQQVDGASDEQRRIERLLDAKSTLAKRPIAQFGDDFLHFIERAQHIRARGLAGLADRWRGCRSDASK